MFPIMKNTIWGLTALLALAGLLTAGGCSLGRSPRPDFYMLSSPVENVVQ